MFAYVIYSVYCELKVQAFASPGLGLSPTSTLQGRIRAERDLHLLCGLLLVADSSSQPLWPLGPVHHRWYHHNRYRRWPLLRRGLGARPQQVRHEAGQLAADDADRLRGQLADLSGTQARKNSLWPQVVLRRTGLRRWQQSAVCRVDRPVRHPVHPGPADHSCEHGAAPLRHRQHGGVQEEEKDRSGVCARGRLRAAPGPRPSLFISLLYY